MLTTNPSGKIRGFSEAACKDVRSSKENKNVAEESGRGGEGQKMERLNKRRRNKFD